MGLHFPRPTWRWYHDSRRSRCTLRAGTAQAHTSKLSCVGDNESHLQLPLFLFLQPCKQRTGTVVSNQNGRVQPYTEHRCPQLRSPAYLLLVCMKRGSPHFSQSTSTPEDGGRKQASERCRQSSNLRDSQESCDVTYPCSR